VLELGIYHRKNKKLIGTTGIYQIKEVHLYGFLSKYPLAIKILG